MILLIDIGNTHTHLGLSNSRRVVKQADIPTSAWFGAGMARRLRKFTGQRAPVGVCFSSVVPRATPRLKAEVRRLWKLSPLQLTPETVTGIGINFPQPHTIGQDRLANAVAVRHHFGAPAVVVSFGTALAFDVVDRRGDYVGGIIAPGLAAMTDYLHERTALLPRIRIRDTASVIGKNTESAMLIGAVHGYRGLVRELIAELKRELKARRLPVIATGGYAKLITAKMPEITAIVPSLTLEGLRLVWQQHHHKP